MWRCALYYVPDIDECLSPNHGCEQTCMNTAGTYICNCSIGYRLNANGRDCNGTKANYFDHFIIYSFFKIWTSACYQSTNVKCFVRILKGLMTAVAVMAMN